MMACSHAASIRRSVAIGTACAALLVAAPLSAQHLADNWIGNGTFDTSIDGWTLAGPVSWTGSGGSPQFGAMLLEWSATPATQAWQCLPIPLPAIGPYRLSAHGQGRFGTPELLAVAWTGPGCAGTVLQEVPASIVGVLPGFVALLQSPAFELAPAAASIQVLARPPGLPVWIDSIEFGPVRNYLTVSGGAGNDYQASIAVPWAQPDARVVVFERLGAGASGDLYVTRSDDGGSTWSAPVPVVATAGNERHAALVQTGAEAWSLFHLSNASGSFRIHRATSTDGATFSASVPVDLGWPAGTSQINPHVIREPDGTLTMTYHLLGGASFIARSTDNGASWDTLRTQVSPGNAALPRIAHRASDDTWLLAYQTGSNPVTLWVKASADPYDWSAPARQLTLDGNNHDAFPMVLDDDSFVIAWARVANGAFQIFSTRSLDGITWATPFQHTDRAGLANVQPHALPGPAPGTIELYWGAAQVPGDGNYDIARLPATGVTDPLFAHGFDVP